MMPVKEFNEAFGRRVKLARLQLKWDLADLANRCYMARSFVALLEDGEVTVALYTALVIATALGVELRNLIPGS